MSDPGQFQNIVEGALVLMIALLGWFAKKTFEQITDRLDEINKQHIEQVRINAVTEARVVMLNSQVNLMAETFNKWLEAQLSRR